jgi:hypothetical protein
MKDGSWMGRWLIKKVKIVIDKYEEYSDHNIGLNKVERKKMASIGSTKEGKSIIQCSDRHIFQQPGPTLGQSNIPAIAQHISYDVIAVI